MSHRPGFNPHVYNEPPPISPSSFISPHWQKRELEDKEAMGGNRAPSFVLLNLLFILYGKEILVAPVSAKSKV